ncbi:uncharacterized protein LOC108487634 isoform X2 [Gossypium arboreum]|uniref:uncharacterized protein LOC108487634 isoform X2 n=1 Tax=Gossypium arboreum TaxID=29729 RepID=UPI0022F156BD|nr:uncharacterized protein LOC108487634 isoform X2 [Gossypium arboreum]
MSTEAVKRSTTGALTVKQRKIDELKPSPALTAEPKKVIIKSADMKDDMQKEAAFEKNNVKKDVADYIKKEFDKKYGPTWHCIVGSNFGPNKTLLRSLGHRHFSDLTGTKAKRNYANNVSEYNTVLASLNAKRSKGNRRYDVIECDPLVRKGLEKTAKHMVIPYMSMLLPPQNWTGYVLKVLSLYSLFPDELCDTLAGMTNVLICFYHHMYSNCFYQGSLASSPDESVVYQALNFALSSEVLEFLVQNLAICLL